MTMTGSIKNYLPQKRFGFILGDDNKDYFFHENALLSSSQASQIMDGALVEFEPTVSPKGYKATKVSIKSMATVAKFKVPDSIVTSKTDTVKGWEILQECEWVITASDKGDPANVRSTVKNLAKSIGANGVTCMTYRKSTGSEGNYNFTVHNITGRPVILGRRNLSGEYGINDFPDINATCLAYKKKCNEAYALAKSEYAKRLMVGLGILIVLTMFFKVGGLCIGFFIMLAMALVDRPVLEGEWLWR